MNGDFFIATCSNYYYGFGPVPCQSPMVQIFPIFQIPRNTWINRFGPAVAKVERPIKAENAKLKCENQNCNRQIQCHKTRLKNFTK